MGGTSGMSSQRVLVGVVMALAVVVLIAGIAAALTKDDGPGAPTGARSTSTTGTLLTTTTTTTRPTTTVAPVPTTTSAPGTTTTTRPGSTTTTTAATVGSPEATANGLMAAYQAGDRAQAERFAVRSVVDVLFEQPFTGSTPQFRGCSPVGADFDCEVDQLESTYRMTVRRQANGTFLVEFIDIQPTGTQPATTTTAPSSTS